MKGDTKMALWKIFFIVVIAILFSAILIKYGRIIIAIAVTLMLSIVLILIEIITTILFFPVELFYKLLGYDLDEVIQKDIVKCYDDAFYKANSKKKIIKLMKKIKKKEKRGRAERPPPILEEGKEEKDVKKILDECKWVL